MKKSNLKKAVLLGLVCSNILAGSALAVTETEVKPTGSYVNNSVIVNQDGWTLGGETQIGSSPYSNVYGGYNASDYSFVQDNSITILGGIISGSIYGGFHDCYCSANPQSNTVRILGGQVTGNIYGGYAKNDSYGSYPENNTIVIDGGIVQADKIYGGCIFNGSTEQPHVWGNTLILGTSGVQAEMVTGFQNYTFKITDNINDGSVMLLVYADSGIDFENSSFNLELEPNFSLGAGQSVTLLDYGANLPSNLIDKFGSNSFGTLSIKFDQLIFTINPDLVLDVKPTALTDNIVVVTSATEATINGESAPNCDASVSYWRNVYGGYGEGNVTNNQVNVKGSAVSVYGGYSSWGYVSNNVVNIESGTHSRVYGGYSEGPYDVSNNVVYITGGTNSNVYGGYSSSGLGYNKVKITGGKSSISGDVVGSFGAGSGIVKDSSVTIDANYTGTINGNIYGCYSVDPHNGCYDNIVEVAGGTIDGDNGKVIAGCFGVERAGQLDRNRVVITGGFINVGKIVGGYNGGSNISYGAVRDSSVEIIGGSVTAGKLYGGEPSSSGTSSGNTLILGTSGVQAGEVGYFQKYVFYLADISSEDTMLTIGGSNTLAFAVNDTLKVNPAGFTGGTVTLAATGGSISGFSEDMVTIANGDNVYIGTVAIDSTNKNLIFTMGDGYAKYISVIPEAVNNNTVAVTGGTTATINSESAPEFEAGGSGYTSWKAAYGGYSELSGQEVMNNEITVQGGSYSIEVIYGGYGSGKVSDNTVNIESSFTGAVTGNDTFVSLVGGYGTGSGDVSDNVVNIGGGSYSMTVSGGYGGNNSSGDVSDNLVNIVGGTYSDSVYGGYSMGSGDVTNNTVKISGGTYQGFAVCGGFSASGNAMNNTVELVGGNLSNVCVYGGDGMGDSMDHTTGNTLIVSNKNISVNSVNNFQNYTFNIPAGMEASDAMLNITGTGNSITIDSNNTLTINPGVMTVGGTITLIDADAAITFTLTSWNCGQEGNSYDTTVTVDANDSTKLIFTLNSITNYTNVIPGATSGNTVVVSSANSATVNGEEVTYIVDSTAADGPWKSIYGGFSQDDGALVTNNTVTFQDGAKFVGTNNINTGLLGGSSYNGSATYNKLYVTGGTLDGTGNTYYIVGGYGKIGANHNEVHIGSNFQQTKTNSKLYIYGGYSNNDSDTDNTDVANYNTLEITGGIFANVQRVIAGEGYGGADHNTLTITGGSMKGLQYVVAGYSDQGDASNNTLSISGDYVGTVTGYYGVSVAGGMAFGSGGSADNNTVTISSGTYSAAVAGGYVYGTSGISASNNTVTIQGGSFSDEVAGGYVKSSTASTNGNGNTLTINDGVFEKTVYAVRVQGGTTNDNTLNINGGTFKSSVYAYSGSTYSNNVLNLAGGTITGYGITANTINISGTGAVLAYTGGTATVQSDGAVNLEGTLTLGAGTTKSNVKIENGVSVGANKTGSLVGGSTGNISTLCTQWYLPNSPSYDFYLAGTLNISNLIVTNCYTKVSGAASLTLDDTAEWHFSGISYDSGEGKTLSVANNGGLMEVKSAKDVTITSLTGSEGAESYVFTLPNGIADGNTVLTITNSGFALNSGDSITVSGSVTLADGQYITLIASEDVLSLKDVSVTLPSENLRIALLDNGTDVVLCAPIYDLIPATYTDNTVEVTSATTGTVTNNSQTTAQICTEAAWRHAYGGYSTETDAVVKGNTITISGTATVTGTVYGGYSGNGVAGGTGTTDPGNTVIVTGAETGNITAIYGGYGKTGASYNNVTIENTYTGKVAGVEAVNEYSRAWSVVGGYAVGSDAAASYNKVSISSGTFTQSICGGFVYDGSTTSSFNEVNISGGTFNGDVYGGCGFRYITASSNKVSISGGIFSGNIYGGYAPIGSSSDNTLEISGENISVKSVNAFQNYTFTLPTGVESGDTMLSITGGTALAFNSTDVFTVNVANVVGTLAIADVITLIDATTAMTGFGDVTTKQILNGGENWTEGKITATDDNKKILFTVTGIKYVDVIPAEVTGNTVTVTSGKEATIKNGEQTTTVKYNDGEGTSASQDGPWHDVYGGYSTETGAVVKGNTITISGIAQLTGTVYGGYSGSGVAGGTSATDSGNTVIVTGAETGNITAIYGGKGADGAHYNVVTVESTYTGTVAGETISYGTQASVVGGYADGGSTVHNATHNKVSLAGGTYTQTVYGGWTVQSTSVADGNEVEISGTAKVGNVVAGGAYGDRNNNKVTILGGTVTGNIYGGTDANGYSGGSTYNNSVVISAGKIDPKSDIYIYGGYSSYGNVVSDKNSVEISGTAVVGNDTYTTTIYGGCSSYGSAGSTDDDGGNTVTIKGGTLKNINYVEGAYANNNVTNNKVLIQGGVIGGVHLYNETYSYWYGADFYGAYSYIGDATGNSLTINGGTITNGYVLKGAMGNTTVSNNKLLITAGVITGIDEGMWLYGADSYGETSSNELNIKGGTISKVGALRGGRSTYSYSNNTASSNKLLISGGLITGIDDGMYLYGGESYYGSATENSVEIKDGVLNSVSTIYGGITWDDSNKKNANNNKISIMGGVINGVTDGMYLYGGRSYYYSSYGYSFGNNAEENEISISGGTLTDIEYIEGGYARQDAKNNKILISGGSVAGISGGMTLYAGYSYYGSATGNSVEISGGKLTNPDYIQGAYGNASANSNEIKITAGEITGIAGGMCINGASTYGSGENNKVTITGGTLSKIMSITGVWAKTGATGNSVVISSPDMGEVLGETDSTYYPNGLAVVGGLAQISGNANGNSVSISTGTYDMAIYGGYAYSGKAENNSIAISGGTFYGDICAGSGTSTSGNTISITGTGATYLGETGTMTADSAVTLGNGTDTVKFTVGNGTDAAALTFASGLDAKANSTLDILTGSSVTLQGTSTLAGAVSGAGSLKNMGTLTAGVANLGEHFINYTGATLKLQGDLTKSIAGEGTTVLQNDITVTEDRNVEGTLDGNFKTIDMQEAAGTAAYTTLTVGKLAGTADLKIDVDLSDTTNVDMLKITTSAAEDTVLNLSDINITKDYVVTGGGTITVPTYVANGITYVTGDGAASGNLTYKINGKTKTEEGSSLQSSIASSKYVYTFTLGDAGKLNYSLTTAPDNIFKNFIEGKLTEVPQTLSVTEDTVDANASMANNTTYDTLNIYVNDGKKLGSAVGNTVALADGDTINLNGGTSAAGIIYTSWNVAKGGTLNLSGMIDEQGVITNAGTLNLNNEYASTTAITNSGTLNVTAANLKADVTNTNGTINLGAGELTKVITEGTLNIIQNAAVITSADNLKVAAVTNNGSIALTGGSLMVALAGTLSNSGELTTAAGNLDGALMNTGTVKITEGLLSQAITGGNIKVQGEVVTAGDNLVNTAVTAVSGGELIMTGGTYTGSLTADAGVISLALEDYSAITGLSVKNNGGINVTTGTHTDATTVAKLTEGKLTLDGTAIYSTVAGKVFAEDDATEKQTDGFSSNNKFNYVAGTLELTDAYYSIDYLNDAIATLNSNTKVKMTGTLKEETITTEQASKLGENVELPTATVVVPKEERNTIIGTDTTEDVNVSGVGTITDKHAEGFNINKLDLSAGSTGMVITNEKKVVLGGNGDTEQGNLVTVDGKDEKVNVIVGTEDKVDGADKKAGTLGIGIEGSINEKGYKLNADVTVNEGSKVEVNGDTEITGKVALSNATLETAEGKTTKVAQDLEVSNASTILGNTELAGSLAFDNDKAVIQVGNDKERGVLSVTSVKSRKSKGVVFADPAWQNDGGINYIENASNVSVDNVNLDASYIAGQNSVIAFGTTNSQDAIDAFNSINTLNEDKLYWGNGEGMITAAIYIHKNVSLVAQEGAEEFVGDIMADGSKEANPGSQANSRVNFAANSLLMVNGNICLNEPANAAIQNIDLTEVYVDTTSKLFIRNATVGDYYILAGANVTTGSTMTDDLWKDSIILSDMFKVVSTDVVTDATNSYFRVTVESRQGGDIPVYIDKSVAPAAYRAVLADKSSEAYKFMTEVCEPILSVATKLSLLNRNADMPEELGVMHNHFNVTNISADAVAKHLALEEHTNGREVWAQAIHSKENVSGLGLKNQGNSYDTQYNGTVVGIDLMDNGKTTLGAALTYIDGKATAAGIHNEGKYYGATLYGRTKIGKDAGVQYDVSYTHSKNELDMYSGCSYGQITGDQKVNSFSIGARFEQELKVGRSSSFVPHIGARWLRMKAGSFTNSLGNAYSSDATNSLIVPLGLSFKASMENSGWKMSFLGDVGYQWNAGNRDYRQHFSYNGAGNSFDVAFADSSSWYAGMGFEFNKKNFTAGVGYRYAKGESTRQNKWSVNLSWAF